MQYWGRCAYDKSLFYLILAKESLDLFLEGERGSKREGGSERRRQGDRETGRQSLCIYKYIYTYIHGVDHSNIVMSIIINGNRKGKNKRTNT